MVICQTLWTNNKKILEDSFGWLTPQYHLMSWALSVLKLAQYYNDLHLYTDSAGKEMLIDQLGLPYTAVFNEYDNLDCQPQLWAFPKLLTYAKQQQPFLHIDGDVFVWHPFKKELLSAGLIAQNLEKATAYYRKVLSPYAERLKDLPDMLKQNLLSEHMRSYNAGILGGHDIDFFRRYVAAASLLIEQNNHTTLAASFNVVFEQLLFFSMAEQEKKAVHTLIDKPIEDYGYHKEYFAEFPNADQLKYLHLIGPHKCNKEVCDWLARHLRQENEEVFLRIVSLFKKHHYFYSSRLKAVYPTVEPASTNKFNYSKSEHFARLSDTSIDFKTHTQLRSHIKSSGNGLLKGLYKYEQKVKRLCTKFRKIDLSHLRQIEAASMHSMRFLQQPAEERMPVKLYRNPYTEIIQAAFDWTAPEFSAEENGAEKNVVISIIPQLFFSGYRELVLDEPCINILVLTEKEISYRDLLAGLSALFPPMENEEEYEAFCELIFLKAAYLIKNRMLLAQV